MDRKRFKRLGDEQKVRKTRERSMRMTGKILRKFILEIANRIPKITSSRVGKRFTKLLKTKTKKPVDDCVMLLKELRVDEDSYKSVDNMMSTNRCQFQG